MNVALFDSTEQEAAEFIRGLIDSTGYEWHAKVCQSNQGRSEWYRNALRYIKYFAFPFWVFVNRRKYSNIIGWQAFYGLVFAFYCKLFHVKKTNTLIIKNFIYKPKCGVIGKIYFRFMNYIVKSEYVDFFVCSSQKYCDQCATIFNEPRDRFCYVPFGINDFTKVVAQEMGTKEKYILSIGRSNRDWAFLIDAFSDTDYTLCIVCDELKWNNLPQNIKIVNDVWGNRSYEMIRDCEMMVIPILDGSIVAGETVLLQAMSFSKPVIITAPSCLADDYVIDGKTGLAVHKDRNSLLNAVKKLRENQEFYQYVAQNSRKQYEQKYSLYSFGLRIGSLYPEIQRRMSDA